MTRRSTSIAVATTVSLVFFWLVVAVRAPSFFWSVINWDESVYLLVSRSVLDGHLQYTDIWDHKQPLNGWLFALSQIIFGQSVTAIRLLACIAVTATSVGLYFLGKETFDERTIGPLSAAGLYSVFSISSGGFATNTELLFAPFVVAAVGLILPGLVREGSRTEPTVVTCFGAGLLLGLATFTKLIAVYDCVYLLVLVISIGWRIRPTEDDRPALDWIAKRLGVVVIGGAIPWLVGAIYFQLAGAFDDFVFANFTFNRLYLAEQPPFEPANVMLVFQRLIWSQNGLLWCVLPIAVILLIARPASLSTGRRRLLAALVLWALLDTTAALSMRRLYLHYYLQPAPALALIGGAVASWLWTVTPRVPRLLKVGIAAVLLAPQSFRIAERWNQVAEVEDVSAAVASYIDDRIQPGETIFVANSQPVIYYLTETRSPTRWAMPQFFVSPVYRRQLGIDLETEMAAIFDQCPEFVVLETRTAGLDNTEYFRLLIEGYLDPGYAFETRIHSVVLFRRTEKRPTASTRITPSEMKTRPTRADSDPQPDADTF